MKQIVMNTVSDKLYESIAAYEDTTDYVNKKADFADALGLVASQMMNDRDVEKWHLVASLLNEYQQTIDLYHDEAIRK